jgi:hypothetical protein
MKVYVGLPMYGGAHGLAVRSLLSLQSYMLQKGHTVEFDIVANGSILPKVRNGIVERFMLSDCDILLFIDSDMVYNAPDVEKLVTSPFDVSVINYRKKTVNHEWNATPITEGGVPIGTYFNGDNWLQTRRAGTGLMAITKTAMRNVKAQHDYPFDFKVVDGDYVGEDYVFCDRLDDLGGQIFILTDAYAAHLGDTVYDGNYNDYLKGLHNAPS